MSDILTSAAGQPTDTALTGIGIPAVERKGVDLAVLKRGARDYLDFMDATKEAFFGYLYHRTGTLELAKTLLVEIYIDVLSRAMSLWWLGTLSLNTLLDAADAALKDKDVSAADIGTVYLQNLSWLSDEEKKSAATMHDALWSLPREAERLLILSLLLGLSDKRIAEVTRKRPEAVSADLATAKELFLSRWRPVGTIATKLQSLVFAPALDIKSETSLRFAVVEKYNALRFRRYQWVIIGGLFALMSNVIVASVLAFAVVTEPPTTLRGTRSQVASYDAVLLQRQIAVNEAKKSVAASFKETQRIVAYDVSRDLTNLGLASALESLNAQQTQESEVDRLIELMQRAQAALEAAAAPVIKLAMALWSVL